MTIIRLLSIAITSATVAYIAYKTNALTKKTITLEAAVTATGKKVQKLEKNTNETMDTILYVANTPPPKGTAT